MDDNKITNINFLSSPTGTLDPPLLNVSQNAILKGFRWREDERPQSVEDLFEPKKKAKTILE